MPVKIDIYRFLHSQERHTFFKLVICNAEGMWQSTRLATTGVLLRDVYVEPRRSAHRNTPKECLCWK